MNIFRFLKRDKFSIPVELIQTKSHYDIGGKQVLKPTTKKSAESMIREMLFSANPSDAVIKQLRRELKISVAKDLVPVFDDVVKNWKK